MTINMTKEIEKCFINNPEIENEYERLAGLQEARGVGDITSKIERSCSTLEALYAVSERHRYNVSTITAGFVGESEEDKAKIIELMKIVYGIRSDHSHGDFIQFINKNGLDSLDQMAMDLDEIMRKVFRKILNLPELNYSFEKTEINRVRTYWDSVRATN